MSHFKLSSLLLIAAVSLMAISCKKGEEDSSSVLYLDGSLSFDLPEFILKGETIKMVPSGLTHPDGAEIGYYWKVSPTMTSYDTTRFLNGLDDPNEEIGKVSDGSLTHAFSDTLQVYTVYCYGYAKDYTNSSTSRTTATVDPNPNGSITGAGIDPENDPSITFDEIHNLYYTTIGNLDWLRQNLCYTEEGAPFRNCEVMDGVFGRYYSYEEAMTACPDGWRLPTDKDWTDMIQAVDSSYTDIKPHETVTGIAAKLMANGRFNGEKMWEYWPAVGEITNESRLSIIPTGYANLGSKNAAGVYNKANFLGVYEYATFWTADIASAEEGTAYYRYIYCDQGDLMIGKGDMKSFGASVRCVRETEN